MFWEKLLRANEHISDLEARVKAFMETEPYRLIPQNDPDSGILLHYRWQINPVPDGIRTVLGDALFNMRSSLDNLAHSLVVAGTGPGVYDYVSFPIAKSRGTFESRDTLRKIRGVSAAALTDIKRLEPYKGGHSEWLWWLSELHNRDKHRQLIFVIGSLGKTELDIGKALEARGIPLVGVPASALPLKVVYDVPGSYYLPEDGTIVKAITSDVNEYLKMTFTIGLKEPGFPEGQAILPTLSKLVMRLRELGAYFVRHGAPGPG